MYPEKCSNCKEEYYETGYWRDGEYCPSCSASIRRREDEKKKELKRKALEIAEKYGLDLDNYPDDICEEVRRELNPKNAGRKSVKYQSEYCELLIEMADEGKTEVEFAASINISQSLIKHWTVTRPKFKQAREIANDRRQAHFENHYRKAMYAKIPCNPSLLNRYAAAKYGWTERTENVLTGSGGEIPVVKIVPHDEGFPVETQKPTAEQAAAAGVEGMAG
jgi:hypothetical protein